MSIAIRIRERRTELGLNQAALGKRIRQYLPLITDTHISKIERGVRRVSGEELPIFARALQCPMDDLVDRIPD